MFTKSECNTKADELYAKASKLYFTNPKREALLNQAAYWRKLANDAKV